MVLRRDESARVVYSFRYVESSCVPVSPALASSLFEFPDACHLPLESLFSRFLESSRFSKFSYTVFQIHIFGLSYLRILAFSNSHTFEFARSRFFEFSRFFKFSNHRVLEVFEFFEFSISRIFESSRFRILPNFRVHDFSRIQNFRIVKF